MHRTSPFFKNLTQFSELHPPEHDPYNYNPPPRQLAPLKPERKYLRLILDSNANDEDLDSIWANLTYDVYKLLPQNKMAELLAANDFNFTLESIAWVGKTAYTAPFLMTLDLMNESVFGNRIRTILKMLKNDYEQFPTDGYQGISTTDKSWLQRGQLTVSFKTMSGAQISDTEFDMQQNTNTRYVASIILSYV